MKDKKKTEDQLINEVAELSQQIYKLKRLNMKQKVIEGLLQERVEDYRLMIENTNDIFVSTDAKGQIKYISPQVKRLGLSPEVVVSKNVMKFIFPEDRERVLRDFMHTMETGEEFPTEFRMQDKEGRIFWFEDIGRVQRDKAGKIIGLNGILRDITERKQAEEALRESEERYRELVNTSVDGVITVDADMKIILWNPGAERIFGYSKEEMKGQSLVRIVPRRYREALEKGFVEFRKSGSGPVIGKTLELESVRKDRTEIAVELSVSSRRIDKTYIATAIVRDITERKQAEGEIRKLNSAIAQSIDGIAIGDLEPKLMYVNEAYARMHSYSAKELIGKKVAILHNKEQMESFNKKIHIIKAKGSWKGEIGHIRKDGTPFPTYVYVTLLKDNDGKPTGTLEVCKDITDRKQMEEDLTRSHEQLRGLTAHLQSLREEERKQIARDLHDDLGQALSNLKMETASLYKRLPKDQASILESTKSMSNSIEAIIKKVQKITSELRPELLEEFGLISAIETYVNEFQSQIGIKCELLLGINKDISLDKDLSLSIFRILQESLTNVVRHAEASRVSIRINEKAGKLFLQIKDNGKGVTKKQIFNSRSFGIIGMRERVYQWKGEFKIKGAKGKGTTITVSIPLKKKNSHPYR